MAGITATYISPTSFSVVGDRTDILSVGRRLKVDCGADGVKLCYIVSSTYTTVTTLVVAGDALTANITTFFYGVASCPTLPKHSHTADEIPAIPPALTTIDTSALPQVANYASPFTPVSLNNVSSLLYDAEFLPT